MNYGLRSRGDRPLHPATIQRVACYGFLLIPALVLPSRVPLVLAGFRGPPADLPFAGAAGLWTVVVAFAIETVAWCALLAVGLYLRFARLPSPYVERGLLQRLAVASGASVVAARVAGFVGAVLLRPSAMESVGLKSPGAMNYLAVAIGRLADGAAAITVLALAWLWWHTARRERHVRDLRGARGAGHPPPPDSNEQSSANRPPSDPA